MQFVAVGGSGRCSHHGWPRRRVKQELGARNILERPASNHLLAPSRVYLLKVPQSPRIVSPVREHAFKTWVCRGHFRFKPQQWPCIHSSRDRVSFFSSTSPISSPAPTLSYSIKTKFSCKTFHCTSALDDMGLFLVQSQSQCKSHHSEIFASPIKDHIFIHCGPFFWAPVFKPLPGLGREILKGSIMQIHIS